MSNSPFSTKKFKDLQSKWYDRLEKDGFKDIESDENNLREWDTSIFGRYNQHTIGATEEYYRLAGQFASTYEFSNKRERYIWERHSEGLSFNEISALMRSKRFGVNSKSSVHLVVKRLAEEMFKENGIRATKKRSNTDS